MLNQSPLVYQAENIPEVVAVVDCNREINFSHLKSLLANYVSFLEQLKLNEGDRIAFVARNRLEEIALLWAIYYYKAVAVPLSNRYTTEQLEQVIKKFSINCFINITEDNFNFQTLCVELPDINQSITSTRKLYDLEFDQTAGIVLSSGSTGEPKGVVHTFGNYYLSAAGANEILNLKQGDRYLLSLPKYHVGGIGIAFRSVLAGATIVIPEQNLSLAENIKKYQITHLSLVATQLKELLETIDNSAFGQLKAILLGGSAIPDNLIEQALTNNIPILKSYGSTESASLVTATRLGDPIEKLKTSGKVLPHRKIKISEEGEILIGGDVVFKKYFNDPKGNLPEDFFATGDIGSIDEDGYLTVTGRKDNMFISGGENIYPEEIEAVLLSHQQIKEAVVVPIIDEKFGFVPAAFILSEEPFDFDQLDWPLEKFKKPKKIFPWPPEYKKTGLKINRICFIERAKNGALN